MPSTLAVGFCRTCGYVAEVVKDDQGRTVLLCDVCDARKEHQPTCQYLKSLECPVGIECEHRLEICPKCDPCTCTKEKSAIS